MPKREYSKAEITDNHLLDNMSEEILRKKNELLIAKAKLEEAEEAYRSLLNLRTIYYLEKENEKLKKKLNKELRK